MLNYEVFRAARVQTEPFRYVVTPGFLSPDDVAAAIRDFPKIDMGGLFLPDAAPYGAAFAKLLAELKGPEVRCIAEAKLGLELRDRPTMITVRSNCQAKDGRIHADATFKLATLLLYLNEPWSPQGAGCGCCGLLPTWKPMQPKSRQRAVFCSASKYNPIRGTAISHSWGRAATSC